MAVHNVAGFTDTAIISAFAAASGDTDASVTVYFPDGVYNVDGQVSFSVPSTCTEFIMTGESRDGTILEDNFNNASWLFFCDINTDKKVRLFHHMTIRRGTGYDWISNTKNTLVYISGVTDDFRITDFRIDNITNPANANHTLRFIGWVRGVIDHSIFDYANYGGAMTVEYDGSDAGGQGDYLWSQPTNYGGDDCMVMEDCRVQSWGNPPNAAVSDAYHAAKWVSRFNTLLGSGHQTHPTDNRGRGARHFEIYCNDCLNTLDSSYFNFHYLSSGTGLIWNCPLPANGGFGAGYKHFLTLHATLRNNNTYGQYSTPLGWGFAGTDFWAGTVDTSGTLVTKTSGNPWLGGSGQNSYAVAANALIVINGVQYTVSSVSDGTHITLTSSAGTQSGVSSYVVSNWAGDPTSSNGYPNLDQPGRGQGDLLSGTFGVGAGVVNTDRSNAGYTSPNAYPRQALEPIYVWQVPWTNPAGSGGVYVAIYEDCFVENRDYYLENPSFISGGGATGVGIGTREEMNDCTTAVDGTAFWVTDEGSWNDGSNEIYQGQGRLYKRVGGSWTLLYEPLTYPHPIVQADGGFTPPPPDPERKTKKAKISRGRH